VKNQILKDFWDAENGICELVVLNKWGKFSAKTICSKEDKDALSYWTGIHLCEYKILIKSLQAKALAFDQRVIGIKHAINVLQNIDSQTKWCAKTNGDSYFNLWCCVEATELEAKKIRAKIKELKEGYPVYAEHLINSKREISNKNY
jgi:hypothetical protein